MHLIQLGTGLGTAVYRVELATEGLEPYHGTLHLFVDASIMLKLLVRIPPDPMIFPCSRFRGTFDHG